MGAEETRRERANKDVITTVERKEAPWNNLSKREEIKIYKEEKKEGMKGVNISLKVRNWKKDEP